MAVRLNDLLVGGLGHLDLPLVEGLALHLPLGLQGRHDILVLPANLEGPELRSEKYNRQHLTNTTDSISQIS